MAEEKRESLSEQSARKSNKMLLWGGVILLILFLLFLMLRPSPPPEVVPVSGIDFGTSAFDSANQVDAGGVASFGSGSGRLVIEPGEVALDRVVLGSQAEAILTVRAENAPILLLGMRMAEAQQDGFEIEGNCRGLDRLSAGESCLLKILWLPKTLRQIHNTLTITWREDSPSAFSEGRDVIQLRGQSTDSKDCVICEDLRAKEEEPKKQAVTLTGEQIDINEDGTVTIDGETYDITPNGLVVNKDGVIIAIVPPERIAVGLNNQVIGEITGQNVVGFNGETIGRLLGDFTIVDSSLKVVGAAIPLVSVMNSQGAILGKAVKDGTVVDGAGTVIGRVLVDETVVDTNNRQIGTLTPWGLVVDHIGYVIGGTLPDGSIMNATNTRIGNVLPNGWVLNPQKELIGGIVPQGAAVAEGCKDVGTVTMNGQVIDTYEQVIGRVTLDGFIVNDSLAEIGSVVREGVVVNEKGRVLGFVNSAGKAIDSKGTVIGCVNPDGTVMAGRRSIGAVLARGKVVGPRCQVIGSVYPDGQVYNPQGGIDGFVRADRYALDRGNRIIGAVVPRGSAIAEGCRLLGMIGLDGQIDDLNGKRVGCVTSEKTVVNEAFEIIGALTPTGSVYNAKGVLMGRIRADGKIIDRTGKVIACINPDGSIVDTEGNPLDWTTSGGGNSGIIINENGEAMSWTIVGNAVFDENSGEIGSVKSNGWVVDARGEIIGVIPPDGVIFSNDGKVLGRYSQKTGVALDANGERFARILPDLTAISGDRSEILGRLIPDGSTFMDLNNVYMGMMQSDGLLLNAAGSVVGAIRADGSVVNAAGAFIAARIPSGRVLSSTGNEIGTISSSGDIMSPARTRVGRVLANGLALSLEGRIIGGIFPSISVPVGADGVLGSFSPEMTSVSGVMMNQGMVSDKNGAKIGVVSPFGIVLGTDGRLLGKLVRIGSVVDKDQKLIGWVSFKGELNDTDGRPIGRLTQQGIAFDRDNMPLGAVIQQGVVVDMDGKFISFLAANSTAMSASGEVKGWANTTPYVLNNNGILGRVLIPGAALDLNGQMIGWTQPDGAIGDGQKVVGYVGADNRILNTNNTVIGTYVPFGSVAINDVGTTLGFVNTQGIVTDVDEREIGRVVAPDTVMSRGKFVGRLLPGSLFVNDLLGPKTVAQVGVDGVSFSFPGDKQFGVAMMSGFVTDIAKKIVGQLTPMGVALAPNLNLIGMPTLTGDMATTKTSGTSVVFAQNTDVSGGVFAPNSFIDRRGSFIGRAYTSSNVLGEDGRRFAERLTFDLSLTTDGAWAGGSVPVGSVIDDYANDVGVVAADGAVLGENNAVVARVLPDGSAATVTARNGYQAMPYAGHVVPQGLPWGYMNTVLGRTTMRGDIIDMADKRIFRQLDDASILGNDAPLAGRILPFIPAVNRKTQVVMGSLSGDGTVVSSQGQMVGTIATNGAVKGDHELMILGGQIPQTLIVNDMCKVIGQTAFDGSVVNGRGDVVGRIMFDQTAVDSRGTVLGKAVRYGPVMSPDEQPIYLGRTLPDSTVVNDENQTIACAKMDGEVMDSSGNSMGYLVERGPVFNEEGVMIARVDARGNAVGLTGQKMGAVRGDGRGTVVDSTGKVIGYNVAPSEELLFGADGRLRERLSLSGAVKDIAGNVLYVVDADGNLRDPLTGDIIGSIHDGRALWLGPDGKLMGYLDGCDLLNLQSEKIASVLPDGMIRDVNGDFYASVNLDGKITAADDSDMGRLVGSNMNLRRCGLSDRTVGGPGRRVYLNDKMLHVGPDGSLMDANNVIVGYMGEDGRPYTFDMGRPGDTGGRVRPDTDQRLPISKEQMDQMNDLLIKRRQGMKGVTSGGGLLTPSASMLARGRKKQDKDWGEGKSVSTWPVDMTRVILRDKAIPAVLVRSIDSRYSDVPVSAIVERHVYAEEGRNILIPAGSRLIGELASESGSNRVPKVKISWTRLIRPDGAGFTFMATSGDAQGRGGVSAYLDDELIRKYAQPVLGASITSAIAYMMATNDEVSKNTESGQESTSARAEAATDARTNFIESMQKIFEQLVADSANVPPVVYVPSGTRITVFANDDLWLRSEQDDEDEATEQHGERPTQAQTPNVASWVDPRAQNMQNQELPQDPVIDAPPSERPEALSSAPAAPNPMVPGGQTPIYTGQEGYQPPILPQGTPTSNARMF